MSNECLDAKLEPGEGSIKKDKHVLLIEALDKLELLPNRVDYFLDKVKGQEQAVNKESDLKETGEGSLSETLTVSPERIYVVINKVDELLNQLDQELY